MRKLGLLLASLILVMALTEETSAQLNRRSVKKNNKRISSFRGRKSNFGKDKVYTAVGFAVNALNYYGDLSPLPQRVSTDISFTRPGFGVSVTHRFGPRYSLQAQFMWGVLKGSDHDSADPNGDNSHSRYNRNLSFRNQIKELSTVAYIDLFENQSTYISRVKWTPYVYAGVAAYLHNPKAQAPATDLTGAPLAEAGQWVNLRKLGTEGQHSNLDQTDTNFGIKPYHTLQFAIPFGAGIRFRINEVIDLWGDIGFRYTFTDYLDDVSRNYVNLDKISSPLAKAMSYRTNEVLGSPPPGTGVDYAGFSVWPGYGSEHPDNVRGSSGQRDIYMVTSIRITYILGATFHKAKFR